MEVATLRGYILEEVLSYLIRTAGYKLLVDSRQDPKNLRPGSAGLEVRGKGGWHQADVLGQLEMVPAFTYPFRLFTEAKHHREKVHMPIIRNAVGIVTDVNQAPLPIKEEVNLPYSPAYHYVYAIFSASGFDPDAVRMATSYCISVVDLSMDEYRQLLEAIDAAAQTIHNQVAQNEGLVKDIRYSLRRSLHTYPEEVRIEPPNHRDGNYYQELEEMLSELVREVERYDRLYVGTVNAPFIIVLKSDDPNKFEKFALKHKDTSHKVKINWSSAIDDGRTWFITPVGASSREKYTLSFKLPNELSSWIFELEKNKQEKAMQAKMEYFSSINVYIKGKGLDHIAKLEFDAEETIRGL
jgi:hypothetical protein